MSNFGNFGKMSKKGVVSALFSFRKVGIPTTHTSHHYVIKQGNQGIGTLHVQCTVLYLTIPLRCTISMSSYSSALQTLPVIESRTYVYV